MNKVKLIGYNIYRTEALVINAIPYTVRFALSNDSDAFALFVSNDINKKQTKYEFAVEVADDYKHENGKKLEDKVLSIIQSDIQNGIL
jgi:hypothetical protein